MLICQEDKVSVLGKQMRRVCTGKADEDQEVKVSVLGKQMRWVCSGKADELGNPIRVWNSVRCLVVFGDSWLMEPSYYFIRISEGWEFRVGGDSIRLWQKFGRLLTEMYCQD